MRTWSAAVAAALMILLSGCTARVAPNPFAVQGGLSRALRVTINWPERSRAINAPSAALSAVVTLQGAGPTGTDISIVVNRTGPETAHSETYDRTVQVRNGTFPLQINYFAETGGPSPTSPLVAEAFLQRINVLPDSSGIADITPGGPANPGLDMDFNSTIQSVEVDPGAPILVGETRDLLFTARAADGSVIPISRGSLIFRAAAGSQTVLLLTDDGVATGVSPGTASVTATVNGITSPPVNVTVTSGTGGTGVSVQ